MSSTIQVKRGTEAVVNTITPAAGEPVFTTDSFELRVGDGTTVGGRVVGGENKIVQFAKAGAILDLSGAAQDNIVVLHTSRACTIVKAILLYTEASSADAGVVVRIGKETDNDYYYTGDSETDKALWYELEVTLLAADIAAGDTVVCSTAGGKAGNGKILVILEFRVN